MNAKIAALVALSDEELHARRERVAEEVERLMHQLWEIDQAYKERELARTLTPPWQRDPEHAAAAPAAEVANA